MREEEEDGIELKEMVGKELWKALHFACSLEFWRMTLFWTFSLLVSHLQLFAPTLFFGKSTSFRRCYPPPPNTTTGANKTKSTPVCIITGATSGLGAAAAYALSREGFYVVLAGRSLDLLSKAICDIRKRNEGAKIKAFQVDLSSFQSIMKFKGSLEQWLLDSDMHSSVQLLINNAGILATSCRLTADGVEQMMGTNYIGAFSLTKVLLPLLESSPVPSRIVNVTSFTHRSVSNIQVDTETISGKCFSKLNGYPFAHIYEYSKLCLLFFSYELHRQFGSVGKHNQVSVIAVDPGAVETNIMRELPSCISWVAFFVLKLLGLLQSTENGVGSILDAALAPPETSGVYFFGGNGRTINSSALSYNTELSKKLWAASCDLFLQLQAAVSKDSKETSTFE